MYRVFIGYDPRLPVAYAVAAHSIQRHASQPVSVCPLILSQLPITRTGVTEFTYSRWLVPWLCGFEGRALFMDNDMVVTGDVVELFESVQDGPALWVNKAQPRFEWPSAMLFDNAQCTVLTPEYVEDEGSVLYDLEWAPAVGTFDPAWNHCVNISSPRDDAKLYHYTQGIPLWPEVRGAVEDKAWFTEFEAMKSADPWFSVHGVSVHFKPVIQRMLSRYGIEAH